jgi:membrane-associated phospholipid phosphatase
LFGSIPLAILLSHLGKWYFSIPRPAAVIEHDQFIIIGKALTGYTSLPSGHTVTIFTAMTVILWTLKSHKKSWSQYLLTTGVILGTLLIAISRVAVGAHWPFDLVLGALFGCYSGLSGIYISQKYSAFTSWVTLPKYSKTHVIFLLTLCLTMMMNEHYSSVAVVWLSIVMVVFTLIKLTGINNKK